MRLAFFFAPLPIVIAGACSLESGGLTGDAGVESGLEDRGSGMTEGGGACACVPNPGMGWTFIGYERDGADPCGGDFAMQKFAVEETMTGPAVCACVCGPSMMDATCTMTGNVTFDVYKNSNCNGSPDITFTATPGCYNPSDYNQNNQMLSAKGMAPSITVTGGMCGAPTTNTTNVPTDLHKGQNCTLTGGLGSGCMNAGDVCVPTVAKNFALCVSNPMPNATCPAQFPNKHRVGVGKTDNRGCSACNCLPDPICVAGARFNDQNDCTGNPAGQTFVFDGQCHTVDTGTNFNGHAISSGIAMTTQRCTAQGGGMPTGTVALDSEYTICCP